LFPSFKKIAAGVLALSLLLPAAPVLAAPQQEDITKSRQALSATEKQLTDIQKEIDKANQELTINKALLPQRQAEYEKSEKQLAALMRNEYESGGDSLLVCLFSAKTPIQALSNMQSMRYVQANKKKVLTEQRKAKEELEASTKAIEANAKKLEAQKTALAKIKVSQQSKLAKQVASLNTSANTAGNFTPTAEIIAIMNSSDPPKEKFVKIMIAMCNDNRFGYSQSNRWGWDFDCSSSIIYSLRMAGFATGSAGTTITMKSALTGLGWTFIANPGSLQRGDILWTSGHTEVYIGGGQSAGFHSSRGHPQTGDQTGTEASVGHNWMGKTAVLRYTGS
jgi:hypothetical protein